MYFEELATKDIPQLPHEHPFHYLEAVIKRQELPKKDIHDKEHEYMLNKWGCNPEHTDKLTIRLDNNGKEFADRMYHIALHLKYWKEMGIRTEHTERFEKESGLNLDDLQLPNPLTEGKSIY